MGHYVVRHKITEGLPVELDSNLGEWFAGNGLRSR